MEIPEGSIPVPYSYSMGKGGNKGSFRACFQEKPCIPNEVFRISPKDIIERLLKIPCYK
jgi:hypothetical protein